MALSLSSTHVRAGVRPCGAQRQSVRPLPPPRAGLGDAIKDIGASFVKIFSKPETNREDWQTTGTTGFQGNISHHGAGKPFKDGFVNKAGVAAAAKADAEQEDQASYLGGAVQNIVGHNFTGDETEPPTGAGAAGWKGDIHDRKTGDGFHSRKV
jgi:hypothetical protein